MKVVFFGTPKFAVPFLNTLMQDQEIDVLAVVTQPDKPVGRGKKLKPSPVKRFALKQGMEIIQPETLKSENVKNTLRQFDAEAFVVVAYGKLIPADILNIPPLGCVNVHPSLLPKYRGPAPMQAAILHGDDKTGVSIMKLDEGMDTGPILDVLEIDVENNETYPGLQEKIESNGAPFLVKTLKKYNDGEVSPTPQSKEGVSITSLLSKSDGRIDWTNSAKDIERKIRAYKPWPGAWTTWDNERIKIHQADVLKTKDNTEPGRVKVMDDSLLVSTGEGVLLIETLQPENKQKMTAQAFLNGHPEIDGDRLG